MGVAAARMLIFSAAVINLLMAGFFWLVSILPADPEVGAQAEFGLVLAPVWRIVFASILAEVVSELMDTQVYQMWTEMFNEKYQWGRVFSSNFVSIPIDSILFSFIAFYGVLPFPVVLGLLFSNLLIKAATTFVTWPLIYLIPNKKITIS